MALAMDGYRYWVERHKLCIELERAKHAIDALPEAERLAQLQTAERDFRVKIDALYAHAQAEFEASPPRAKA
jgi:hypothetical protein